MIRSSELDHDRRLPLPIWRTLAVVLLAAIVIMHFHEVSRALLLLYAAAIVAVVLNGLVRRLPLGRGWISAIVALIVVAALVAFLWWGGSHLLEQVRSLADRMPEIQAQATQWVRSIERQTGIRIGNVVEQVGPAIASMFGGGSGVAARLGAFVEGLMTPLIILAGGLFALAQPNDRLLNPFMRAVPHDYREPVRRTFDRLSDRLGGWLKGKLLAMLAVGTLASIAFSIIGVPSAVLLGIVNGLLEFVPIIGPWLGGIPAVVIATVADPTLGLYTAIAVLGIQLLENSVITPLAMSGGAHVHPFVTLFALILFGSLFGILGILLAVPLVLLIGTAVEVFWIERTIHSADDRIEPVAEE